MRLAVFPFLALWLCAGAAEARTTYKGGDGSSQPKVIVIDGAHGEIDGIESEYLWLDQHSPG